MKGVAVASAVLVLIAAGVTVLLGVTSAGAEPPQPETNFAGPVMAPRPCALDTKDSAEAHFYQLEGWEPPNYERYPGACERLRFAYGPIIVKPGQNDVLVEPVTIEKPNMDGYITRFKPNLVDQNGNVPPVEQVHLHHGTWLSEPSYGSGPFFAAGEEKTIAPFPRGYGMPIKASDTWQLLYMVHSAVSQPLVTYITYDIDFVPKAAGDKLGLKPVYPIWLDVRPAGYPVFNVERGFGEDGRCTWPKQQCAKSDPYGKVIVGQGKAGNGVGQDFELPKKGEQLGGIKNFTGGTLIGIGGHLHPGGIQNEIDLARPGGEDVQVKKRYRAGTKRTCVKRKHGRCVKTKRKAVYRFKTVTEHQDSTRIYTGKALYWDWKDHAKDGGPKNSWDFSMRVMGSPYWGVHVNPGDKLRSNATYDTNDLASYEDMGIAVALLAPDTPDGKPTAPGVDPFRAPRDYSEDCKSGPGINGKLCMTGLVTHGHYAENGNHTTASGKWSGKPGPQTDAVGIANFQYFPGDLNGSTGVPQVKLGTNLKFFNSEGLGIYHTITTCAFPCLGGTSASFPVPDGATSQSRKIDFDSSELGVGLPAVGATSQKLDWSLPVDQKNGFKPGEVVTYFCRIHPFMRGAFEVTK
ncbi:MAG: hypothetical protein QOJ29_4941 [Thermoleophilaceae bacterium]|nr:hypothetical protein [Thermoleophilaceae bacterium]